MGRFRRWTILVHRYLGVGLSVFFATWFLSGIAMIYAGGMPALTPDERLRRMSPLDPTRVRLTVLDAADRAEISQRPVQVRMLTIMGRPAYRFLPGPPVTVFADTGGRLEPVSRAQSLMIAGQFMNLPSSALHHVAALATADQWTIAQHSQAPFHKIAVDDPAHTEVYVSVLLGEVVMQTTRSSRWLAWVAAIPHWLYFAPLRLHPRAWTLVVLWTSGLGALTAAAGVAMAVMQYRVRYVGLVRWHYMYGAFFGVFALAWVFSGFLSMQPADWAASDAASTRVSERLSGGQLDLGQFPRLSMSQWQKLPSAHSIKEVEFRRVQDDPYYLVHGAGAPQLVSAGTLAGRVGRFPLDDIMRRVTEGYPGASIIESALLSGYDSYYYDRHRTAPLPVLRVKFGDRQRTWMYLDPAMSEVVAQFSRRQRVERWLYHGLHSLDFSFWYYNRPLWDIGVITLCLGGAVLSLIGAVLGFKRLRTALLG